MIKVASAIQEAKVQRWKKYKTTPAQQKQAAIRALPTYGIAATTEKSVPWTCLSRKTSPSVLTTMRN